MSTFSIQSPSLTVAASRSRAFATQALSGLVRGLEAVGRARAAEALRRMDSTRVTEAARMRLYAQGWAHDDPRVMADLMAAADRHERGG